MKTPTLTLLLSLFALTSVCLADNVVVRVTDDKGAPVLNAQVAAILKSGAYQDAKLDESQGDYKCQPAEECIKVFCAAPGYEAAVKKYIGSAGTCAVTLKANSEKSSAVLTGRTVIPTLDGELGPRMEGPRQMRMFAWKIALLQGGRPVKDQSILFSLNHAIDAQTGTGKKFKICVVDMTQQVSLIEFTTPK